jgi:hypothetical protein
LQAVDTLQGRADVWPVFVCYRQTDGRRIAEWLFTLLNGVIVPQENDSNDSARLAPRLDVYFDKAAPGVGDWTAVHEPYLKRARAFILVCTRHASSSKFEITSINRNTVSTCRTLYSVAYRVHRS